MTDKEIIKALECCINDENCENCPLHHKKIENACVLTVVEFYKEILDLINRQQAEIERLNIRLRKERHQFDDLGKMYSEIRAEAIKEFAQRLKKEKYSVCAGHGMSECVVSVYDINNLVKEMVGEDK